jgi:hypothetical protein
VTRDHFSPMKAHIVHFEHLLFLLLFMLHSLTQKASSLVNLVDRKTRAHSPQSTPDEALGVVRNLHIRNIIRRPGRKPRSNESGETSSITINDGTSESSSGAALGNDAGENGNGKQGHLLNVVGLRILCALVLLEAGGVLGFVGTMAQVSNLHFIGDFALHRIWRKRGLGVCIVDLVAGRGEDALRVRMRNDAEDVVCRNG